VLASVSQREREVIGERTSEVLRHTARQGEHTGGEPPFGWRIDTTTARVEIRNGKERRIVLLAPHPDEQAVIARARELVAGGLSLRAIAARLAADGMVSRTGKSFVPCAVAKMLEAAPAPVAVDAAAE
jgi:DNA invertase Pin-like site-specific DNA recombinase